MATKSGDCQERSLITSKPRAGWEHPGRKRGRQGLLREGLLETLRCVPVTRCTRTPAPPRRSCSQAERLGQLLILALDVRAKNRKHAYTHTFAVTARREQLVRPLF